MFRASMIFGLLGSFLCACAAPDVDSATSATTTAEDDNGVEIYEPVSGVYEISTGVQVGECRDAQELEKWNVTINLPEGDGSWELVEDYGGDDLLRQEPIPCNITNDFAICGVDKKRDYTMEDEGILANVLSAKRNYELQWISETEFEGIVVVEMLCEGSGCDDIGPDYQVNEWPCHTEAELTGKLVN